MFHLRYVFALMFALFAINVANADETQDTPQKFSHVIMVWLKQPQNPTARHQFIEASRQLNSLPGIINRHVGVVVPTDKAMVDDTFDVAVTVTLNSRQAFENYMSHPKHLEIIEKKLKPLVNRIVAYDFISEE